MNRKHMAAVAMSAAVVLTAGMQAAAAYTPGTYDATAAGRNGDITLHVTFDEMRLRIFLRIMRRPMASDRQQLNPSVRPQSKTRSSRQMRLPALP